MDKIFVNEASGCSGVQEGLNGVSSLVSVVPISTGRRREVSRASKALIAKSLGSLFSHLGLRSGAGTGGLGGGVSVSPLSIVLGSSIVNTVNLFTSDRCYAVQNFRQIK